MNLIAYAPLLIHGAGVTLGAWLVAGTISMIVGTFLGVISADNVGSTTIKRLITVYSFITKGIPVYVQILIVYYALPSLLSINIPPFVAASGALAICSSGYVVEMVRSGINAISPGQWDACFVLGYTKVETIRHIIAPQALRITLPALMGELEQLLKSTSLFAAIGVTEVTRAGMNIISRELNPMPVYGIIALIYLLFSAALALVRHSIEKRIRS